VLLLYDNCCLQINDLLYNAATLKECLNAEAKAWRDLICRHMNIKFKGILTEIDSFMDELLGQLARPIKDLEDVRLAMQELAAVRARQLDIDASLGPIEARLSLLILLSPKLFYFNFLYIHLFHHYR